MNSVYLRCLVFWMLLGVFQVSSGCGPKMMGKNVVTTNVGK